MTFLIHAGERTEIIIIYRFEVVIADAFIVVVALLEYVLVNIMGIGSVRNAAYDQDSGTLAPSL